MFDTVKLDGEKESHILSVSFGICKFERTVLYTVFDIAYS